MYEKWRTVSALKSNLLSDGHVEHHHTVDKAVTYNVGAIVGLCVGILLVVVVIATVVAGLKGYLQSPAKYYVKFVSNLIICLLLLVYIC